MRTETMDLEKLLDSFLEFEDEYGMFRLKVGKVKVWHYIRYAVFTSLLAQFGLAELTMTVSANQNTSKYTWDDFVREKVLCNQFFAHKKDVIIIPHKRKYKEADGYYRCIYTDLLDKAMTRPHYILDRRSVEGIYARQRSKNILYLDLEKFGRVYKTKQTDRLMNKSEFEKDIVAPLEKYYNIVINRNYKQKWIKALNTILENRRSLINYYHYMFHRIKPKVILVTVSYEWNMMILCETAKKMKIPVVELQHGTINRSVVSYNFFRKMNLSTFPDYVFTFGQLEKAEARFPIGDDKVIPVGFPELENSYKHYNEEKKGLEKKKKQILFISQGLIEIAQYAAVAAEMLDSKEYGIIFKLHPKEYGNWGKLYGTYLDHPNIEVVGDFNRTIHSFLAEADWVVGNYSTVLHEATMFDVKIAVIKTALYSVVSNLYDNGYAVLVDSPQKLVEEIREDTFKINPTVSVFERNSIENMLEWVDKIIDDTEGAHD